MLLLGNTTPIILYRNAASYSSIKRHWWLTNSGALAGTRRQLFDAGAIRVECLDLKGNRIVCLHQGSINASSSRTMATPCFSRPV